MLYHLFTTLRELYDLPGAGLFSFVSFRAGMSLMTSLVVGLLFGKRIIERLQLKQVGEIVRELGLEGHRCFDLGRQGRAAEVLEGFVPGKSELFPIPTAEITLSNGQLTQNPGYE